MRTRVRARAIARAVAKSESTSDPKLKTHSQNQRLLPSLKWMVGVYVLCRLHVHTMGSSLHSFSLKLVKGCGASKMLNEILIPKQLTSPCFQFDCLSLLLFPSLSLYLFLWLTRLIHAQLPSQEKQIIVLMNAQPLNNSEQLIARLHFFFREYDKRKIVASSVFFVLFFACFVFFQCWWINSSDFHFRKQKCNLSHNRNANLMHQTRFLLRKRKQCVCTNKWNTLIQNIAKQKLQGRPLIKRCMTKAIYIQPQPHRTQNAQWKWHIKHNR